MHTGEYAQQQASCSAGPGRWAWFQIAVPSSQPWLPTHLQPADSHGGVSKHGGMQVLNIWQHVPALMLACTASHATLPSHVHVLSHSHTRVHWYSEQRCTVEQHDSVLTNRCGMGRMHGMAQSCNEQRTCLGSSTPSCQATVHVRLHACTVNIHLGTRKAPSPLCSVPSARCCSRCQSRRTWA